METKIQVQRIATKAIIANEKNQVLILREALSNAEGTIPGKYVLPGGRLEMGERHLDGLKREINEETGLEITVEEPVLVGEWFPVIKGIPNQIVCIFFACKAKTTAVRLSHEHDDYTWINPQNLDSFSFAAYEREAIEKWHNKNAWYGQALEKLKGSLEQLI